MLEHEGQGVMCFPFHLHRVSMEPSKIRTEYLGTLVAAPGQGACKHGISEDSVVQTTILEYVIVGAEPACQCQIHNVPHTILSGALDCPLGLMQRDTPMLG